MHYTPRLRINPMEYTPPQCIRLIICQNNVNIAKKQKHIIQISVWELHNYIILPIPQGCFFGARTFYGKVYIGDKSLSKDMTKYIKPTRIRNKITCGLKKIKNAMLLKPDLNKWRLSQLSKLDKFYSNSASTTILQRSKID